MIGQINGQFLLIKSLSTKKDLGAKIKSQSNVPKMPFAQYESSNCPIFCLISMSKLISRVLLFCLGLILTILPFSKSVLAEQNSIAIDNQEINNEKLEIEISIDELLGPEENFPFLPENHRDSSNPIGRIGKILGEP